MRNTMLSVATALAMSVGVVAPVSAFERGVHVADAEPTVDDILNACLEAMGGRKAIDAIKTLHVTAKMNSAGMQVDADWKWSKEGGRTITYDTPMGAIKQGTDGEIGWSHNPMIGYVLATDEEMDQMDNQAGLHMAMADLKKTLLKDSEQLEYVGTERFASQECHAIYQLDKDGSEGYMYFSVANDLPVGFRSIPEVEGGSTDEMVLSDWKAVNKVQFFHAIEMTSGDPNAPGASMKIETVEINTLESDAFAVPDEVKELAKQSEADANAPDIKLEDLGTAHQAQATQMINEATQAPGTEPIKQIITAAEGAIRFMQGDDKKMYQYVVQELKKELKKRGG